jgi:hypothetical protein
MLVTFTSNWETTSNIPYPVSTLHTFGSEERKAHRVGSGDSMVSIIGIFPLLPESSFARSGGDVREDQARLAEPRVQ